MPETPSWPGAKDLGILSALGWPGGGRWGACCAGLCGLVVSADALKLEVHPSFLSAGGAVGEYLWPLWIIIQRHHLRSKVWQHDYSLELSPMFLFVQPLGCAVLGV